MSDFQSALTAAFGEHAVKANVLLGQFTTFRVGGPADWLLDARSAEHVRQAVALARDAKLPVTILGGGSNVLISDAGLRGLVVRMRGGGVRQVSEGRVRADAAVSVNGLVRWTILRGLAGLEAWAGTPGTVGGAIFGNAHFAGALIGTLVEQAALLTPAGAVETVHADAMGFGYDRSRLQTTGEIVMWVDFRVSRGEPSTLRGVARQSLAFRKRTQPLDTPSAGCVFQNPEPGRDRVPDGIPWSAGALLDRAGLKGTRIGGAVVSPTHGNFILNDGSATAADIRALVERCRLAVAERFGVELREEIVFLGDFSIRPVRVEPRA